MVYGEWRICSVVLRIMFVDYECRGCGVLGRINELLEGVGVVWVMNLMGIVWIYM